jgi:hypothetical protein
VERFGRAEEVYPSRELRTGREFAYVAIVTLNPRFADPKALAASNTEPRTISAGDPVLIRGWRQPAGASTPAAPARPGSGSTARSSGPIKARKERARGSSASAAGRAGRCRTATWCRSARVWGDPYVSVESDGRLLAFRGPAEATLFRLEKRGGSPAEFVREGDGFALIDARNGKVLQAERGRVTTGPAGDSPGARFASVLVPRIGAAAK